MTIQRAIKSGKPFRRKGWADDDVWVVYQEGDPAWFGSSGGDSQGDLIDVLPDDILATDWEVKENP